MEIKKIFKIYFYTAFICIFFSIPAYTQDALSDFKELRSEHFILRYAPEVRDDTANTIKNNCEEYYRKITEEFNLIRDNLWLWENRAQVFISKDQNQYKNLFSCPDWSSACVDYQGKIIYLFEGQQNTEEILSHELTHIISKEYTGTDRLPLWLNEGMSMYIPIVLGTARYDEAAFGEIIKRNEYIPFEQLAVLGSQELSGMNRQYIEIFYKQSFSIINFLIKYYGRERFSLFLFYFRDSGKAEDAFSKTYPDCPTMLKLQQQWLRFYSD